MPESPRARLHVEEDDGESKPVEVFPHLERAPITEALLDVRVRARKDLQAGELQRVAVQLRDEYPVAEERRVQFSIPALGQAGVPSGPIDVHEYYYRSVDRRDVVQFRVDGFALNRLKPYQSWLVWFPRFKRLWSLYMQLARPESVTRVAVRCINLIDLPSGRHNLEDFLTAPPPVPKGLPDSIGGFVTNVALVEETDPPRWLNLTQALQGIGPEGTIQLRIDVEAFVTGDFPPGEIIPLFEPLHMLRNRAFFRSITPRTVALFQ